MESTRGLRSSGSRDDRAFNSIKSSRMKKVKHKDVSREYLEKRKTRASKITERMLYDSFGR